MSAKETRLADSKGSNQESSKQEDMEMGRKINRFLKGGVAVGVMITAYQAAQTTKKE